MDWLRRAYYGNIDIPAIERRPVELDGRRFTAYATGEVIEHTGRTERTAAHYGRGGAEFGVGRAPVTEKVTGDLATRVRDKAGYTRRDP